MGKRALILQDRHNGKAIICLYVYMFSIMKLFIILV